MKCPKCGTWNAAYLPKCVRCGRPLEQNMQKSLSWEAGMHKKKPFLQVTQFDSEEPFSAETLSIPDTKEEYDTPYDPDALNRAELADELEELKQRRRRGEQRLEQMKKRVAHVQQAIHDAQVIRPVPEPEDAELYDHEQAYIRHRQQNRQEQYTHQLRDFDDHIDDAYNDSPYFSQGSVIYDDSDESAPVYYDGYEADPNVYYGTSDMASNVNYSHSKNNHADGHVKKNKGSFFRVFFAFLGVIVVVAALAIGAVFGARYYVKEQGLQARRNNDTRVEVSTTTVDDMPAHVLTFYGKENATVYLKEMQASYVIADGQLQLVIPDYMWYDTDSSTYAKAVQTDTMDVSITPFIRSSQEGEQIELDPIQFTIDVPPSPIYLLNPPSSHLNVGVSIYEVRINVPLGSTVIIDGTNVSTLIRKTGNVSKNVQVLPIGDNIIPISVKSKYCRESTMEVVLTRAAQEISLELEATVMSEWNYGPVTENDYIEAVKYDEDPAHKDETPKKLEQLHIPKISGTTLPGAEIQVDFPHFNLKQNMETGDFSFNPIFTKLGDNDVVIRAKFEGKADSVITHTVYYMPNEDIYTRRAWDLSSQYTDLINYIQLRKGTIYMGTGTVERIISSTPQMAIMNIGTTDIPKQIMIENSSKTTWEIGSKYRIYGDVYGLYDTMPRLTVRYTYLLEE